MLPSNWREALQGELSEPYFEQLAAFVEEQRRSHEVFPAAEHTFEALSRTAPADVRVLLLGQDPYHGPGQAHGLCFSVPAGVPHPPSLRNIFRELAEDLGCTTPHSGDLSAWADRGVLLLNTVLTVRAREAGSHQRRGWERFTDAVIRAVDQGPQPVVFLLWGTPARKKRKLIGDGRHRVVEGVHPSPLSAHRGFFGSRPFSTVNRHLVELGQPPVDWAL